MAGMRFEGDSEDTEFVANQRVVSHNTGGIEATVAWNLQPHNGDTEVTFDADYHVPVPLLGKLAEALVVKMNEHEAETILANLKDRMEA
jgi:carbon monoxide dehydrogenase subunit G